MVSVKDATSRLLKKVYEVFLRGNNLFINISPLFVTSVQKLNF